MKIVRRFVSSLAVGLLLTSLAGCGGEEGGPSGMSATLSWDPVQNPNISAYTVHYGRQSSGQQGSCDYESAMDVDVSSSFATITGLEPDTTYYFAVSVYNGHGHRSRCSEEVFTVTQASQI